MESFGPHLMIDLSGCKFEKLVDFSLVYNVLDRMPEKLGMEKMILPYVVKWLDKGMRVPGVSGFVMIAESHISVHTFPEKDYVFIDIFSCKEFDTQRATEYLIRAFGASRSEIRMVKRGKGFPREIAA